MCAPIQNRKSAVPRHKEIDDQLVIKICKDLGVVLKTVIPANAGISLTA